MSIEQRVRRLLEVASAKAKGTLTVAISAALAGPALPDNRVRITQYEQQLSDAITNGTPAVWDKYLDRDAIYAEEDHTSKGKRRDDQGSPSGKNVDSHLHDPTRI
jgi:hypothetical protein